MNIAVLQGRLTKDVEVRYTDTGKVVANFTLAVNRPFADKDGQREADFIPVVLWNKTAEVAGNNVHKGDRLAIVGRIQVRNYTDKNGAKRYVTEVVANSVEFLERKNKNAGESNMQSFGQYVDENGKTEDDPDFIPF